MTRVENAATTWHCATKTFSFPQDFPLVMGILNVTPDSFSDGGTHNQLADAVAWAHQMKAEGAHIIDIGGESTRPGFDEEGVSLEEERRRVLPVAEALVKEGFIVSIDTSKPEIMRETAALGVHILNDIRGFTLPGALEAAASTDCGLVIMHRAASTEYDNLIADVERFLREQSEKLLALGVAKDRLCWDPGFGFGKTVEQNFELLAATDYFVGTGYPYLMGLSRKSSIGAVTNHSRPTERIYGSVVGALMAIERGAQVVRVHDCAATVDAIRVWQATEAAAERVKNNQ